MQVLSEPRLVHEKEDVHLLRTFGFSTKMNQANWRVAQSFGHQLAKDAVRNQRDMYAIPERIFNEDLGWGHPKGTKEEEYSEIRENSVGNIVKSYGPFYYNDNSGDYWYDFGVKLNGSRAASIIMENGSKTWTPFAVSAHIWPTDGNDDNITGAEFMGLGMVIKGAYGDQSVIGKYCKGGAVKCEQSLAAAIQDVINNSLNTENQNTNIMSTQLQTGTTTGNDNARVGFIPNIDASNEPVKQVPILETQEKKDITLTKDEYDSLQKQLKEQEDLRTQITDLRNEHKTTILNQVFADIEDTNTRDNLVKKYFDKDEKLVKELNEDFIANILPAKIEAALKQAKEEGKKDVTKESKTASVMREEPKVKQTEESKTASIEKEVTISELLQEMGL